MTTQRYSAHIPAVTIGTTVAASVAIDFSSSETGRVHIPAGSSLTTLNWYASLTDNGVYTQVRDGSNADVTSTVAAGFNYAFPAALIGARFVKIVGNAASVAGITMKD